MFIYIFLPYIYIYIFRYVDIQVSVGGFPFGLPSNGSRVEHRGINFTLLLSVPRSLIRGKGLINRAINKRATNFKYLWEWNSSVREVSARGKA